MRGPEVWSGWELLTGCTRCVGASEYLELPCACHTVPNNISILENEANWSLLSRVSFKNSLFTTFRPNRRHLKIKSLQQHVYVLWYSFSEKSAPLRTNVLSFNNLYHYSTRGFVCWMHSSFKDQWTGTLCCSLINQSPPWIMNCTSISV